MIPVETKSRTPATFEWIDILSNVTASEGEATVDEGVWKYFLPSVYGLDGSQQIFFLL
jgi:hypothetical protein